MHITISKYLKKTVLCKIQMINVKIIVTTSLNYLLLLLITLINLYVACFHSCIWHLHQLLAVCCKVLLIGSLSNHHTEKPGFQVLCIDFLVDLQPLLSVDQHLISGGLSGASGPSLLAPYKNTIVWKKNCCWLFRYHSICVMYTKLPMISSVEAEVEYPDTAGIHYR